MNKYSPKTDGIDHINVYSKGQTLWGRWLSNFTYSPFTHPEDGHFNSIEGYWYWLGCKDDSLRTLYGYRAKEEGRRLGAADWLEGEEFKRKIKLALLAKIKSRPDKLKDMPRLPLTHYYVYGKVGNEKVVQVPEGQWIIDYLEEIIKE